MSLYMEQPGYLKVSSIKHVDPFASHGSEMPANSKNEVNNFQESINTERSTGTTIMAITYADGVIVAGDTRATMGGYISQPHAEKLDKIDDRIYICRSGSAADTLALSDYCKFYMQIHKREEGGESTVRAAAHVLQHLAYSNRNHISAGFILGGVDSTEGGSVYSIPVGGDIHRVPYCIHGSGSIFIYGYCEDNYKQGMSREEGIEFCRKAVSLAMNNDGSSGGMLRMVIITQDKVERLVYPSSALPNVGL